MKPERWQQVKETLAEALECADTRERVSFLQKSCADDTALRREVESLLDQADDELDACAESVARSNAARLGSANVGRRIGAYELLRELGRGGMGAVWLARRADQQFEKLVAIKLLKRGTDTDEVLRRFHSERQILARLEHPNIARLIDGGTTDDDLPYFVMEHVEGARVTDYCFAQNLSLPDRLRLFQKICAAVQFAHQNLVVHRDLKPANILVTANGEPKLLDFGIAKLLEPGDEALQVTLNEHQRLTPAYASPEQVRGEPITTVSDIYTLGTLLYELLTGQPAHRFSTPRPPPTELFEVVVQAEPLRPSAAAIDPTTKRRLRGDLDNILLKALRKEPGRRYDSVGSFSADIQRHLDNRPVLARRDTFTYRSSKFLQRNRLGTAAGALVLLTLMGGIVGITWEARRATRRFNEVRQLAHSVLFDYHDAIANLPGSTPVREKLVKDSLRYLDNLANEGGGDTQLGREIASAYLKVGDVQGLPYTANLGDTAGALVSYSRAGTILEGLIQKNPRRPDLRYDLCFAYERISRIQIRSGAPDEALRLAEKNAGMIEQLTAAAPANTAYRELLGDSYLTLGKALYLGSREFSLEAQRRALLTYQQALAIHQQLASATPTDRAQQNKVATDLSYIGYAYWKIGHITSDPANDRAALENFHQSLESFTALASAEPANARFQRNLVSAYSDIAQSHLFLDDLPHALPNLQSARAICERLVAADPANLEAKCDLAEIHGKISAALERSNLIPEALVERNQSLAMYESLLKSDPANIETRDYLLAACRSMTDLLAKADAADGPAPEDARHSLAVGYANLGNAEAAIAASAGFPAQTRRENLQAAAASYQRSLGFWQDLKASDSLGHDEVSKPDEIAGQIAKCELALRVE